MKTKFTDAFVRLINLMVMAVVFLIQAIVFGALEVLRNYHQRNFALNMINYVGPGDKLVVVAPYAANAGAGMQVGNNLFGIAVDTLTSGATGVMATEGVFDITKTTTAALAIGDKAYWDNTNKRLTATSTSNLPIGVVLETAATTASTARVKLAECPIVAAGS